MHALLFLYQVLFLYTRVFWNNGLFKSPESLSANTILIGSSVKKYVENNDFLGYKKINARTSHSMWKPIGDEKVNQRSLRGPSFDNLPQYSCTESGTYTLQARYLCERSARLWGKESTWCKLCGDKDQRPVPVILWIAAQEKKKIIRKLSFVNVPSSSG